MIVYEQKARAEMCGLFLYPFSILPMIQAAVTGCFFHAQICPGTALNSASQMEGFGRSEASKATWEAKNKISKVIENASKYDKILLDEATEDLISEKPFSEILPLKGKMSDRAVRKWYLKHEAMIPSLVDNRLPIEEQARKVFGLRNLHRTQARDLIYGQKLWAKLDETDPNFTFEELIESKMRRKGLTREEAVLDILKTATKTRKSVNKSLGLE